jgi:Na+/H+ antiporter NhaD/arsenite permease-like protein
MEIKTELAHVGTVLAALIGASVEPMITPFGSLATMLVLAFARRDRVGGCVG